MRAFGWNNFAALSLVKLKFRGMVLGGPGALACIAAVFLLSSHHDTGLLPHKRATAPLPLRGNSKVSFCMIKSLYHKYPHWLTESFHLVHP